MLRHRTHYEPLPDPPPLNAIELCSGSDPVTTKFRLNNLPAKSYEIKRAPNEDLTSQIGLLDSRRSVAVLKPAHFQNGYCHPYLGIMDECSMWGFMTFDLHRRIIERYEGDLTMESVRHTNYRGDNVYFLAFLSSLLDFPAWALAESCETTRQFKYRAAASWIQASQALQLRIYLAAYGAPTPKALQVASTIPNATKLAKPVPKGWRPSAPP